MKKLRFFILVFCFAISIPLLYFIQQTYRGLEQEELAELRFFADAIFNEMEEELEALVIREQGRAIEEYNQGYSPAGTVDVTGTKQPAVSSSVQEPYILGYIQNNPDGSFQTRPIETNGRIPQEREQILARLSAANEVFNKKRSRMSECVDIGPGSTVAMNEENRPPGFADRYVHVSEYRKQKSPLHDQKTRVLQITIDQVLNILPPEHRAAFTQDLEAQQITFNMDALAGLMDTMFNHYVNSQEDGYQQIYHNSRGRDSDAAISPDAKLQVEIDPLQSVFIDDHLVYVFRRIVLNSQVYRQGFVIEIEEFLDRLTEKYFALQPMARFTNMRLKVVDKNREVAAVRAGAFTEKPQFSLDRAFPRPFSFLEANINCDDIPRSSGRRTLTSMLIVLAGVVLLGLFGIYKSAQTVVDLSERRSGFVSSVTHELKTPLSTIRMYIEMLEQGIARDHNKEQEYFRILGSESARLGRLINNVLEFSKLEKKQRRLNLQEGTFEEVVQEVRSIMYEKLRKEKFILHVQLDKIEPFAYDREVMLQVLINLIENSIKFGNKSPRREITLHIRSEGKWIRISVSDTGPGIPRHALKKVFDNFYRVDNQLTRDTGGTGIGLSLVRNYISAMGGTVSAVNNDGSGCTVTMSLRAQPS